MKKWILTAISISFFLTLPTAWAANPSAQTFITNWFSAMKEGNIQKAGEYLAPQFISIHTDGIVRDKTQELELIKNLHMKSFKLTDFHTTTSDNTIIATFKDTGSELIDNKPIAQQAAGRMAILQLDKNGQMQMIAYANLDKIN